MKTIYHVMYEGELGEAEGFYNKEQELLHSWDCNDANYRHEYMNPLLLKLGINVVRGSPFLQRKFKMLVEINWS